MRANQIDPLHLRLGGFRLTSAALSGALPIPAGMCDPFSLPGLVGSLSSSPNSTPLLRSLSHSSSTDSKQSNRSAILLSDQAIDESSIMDRAYGWNMQQQHSGSGSSAVQTAKLRYESARSFDSDEDIEWNPCMTAEELTAAYSESSLSSRSGRSEVSSPPQQPTIPLPMSAYSQQQQPQHMQHGNHGSGRYNSRKNRNTNAVPIVNPNHFNVQQWR